MSANAAPFAKESHPSVTWRLVVGYALMLLAAVGIFFVIRNVGESMSSAVATEGPQAGSAIEHADALYHVLLALASIMVLGRLLGKLFQHFGQPRVIGEMVAGIMLGPSLLGRIWPAAQQFILPDNVGPNLGIIAQIGVILYMFLIGLELNAGMLRSRAHATVAISHASIVAPFLLGGLLALWLYPRLAEGVSFTSFALFMGVAMSITAFPVLARILTDRGMEKTELGVIAISCAATDDVTAWCLLAFVVGVARSEFSGALTTAVYSVLYIGFMFAIIRPLAIRYLGPDANQPPRRMAVWVLVALLVSSMTAHFIGIHAIFGAFLLGAVIPHDSEIASDFRNKLEDIVKILLLPAFFAYTGMRTQIDLVSGWQAWLIVALIIVVATVGKFGGTYVAARLTGLPNKTSAALGILMNTRGLMELIVLNIGLEMKVISPKLFAMMVIMALATTIMTTPVLHWLKAVPEKTRQQAA